MKKSSALPEAIGSKGSSVIFRFYVDVDAESAIKNNVLFLEYQIVPDDILKVSTPKFSVKNSKNIYQIPALRSEKLERDENLIVYAGRVDITKYFPNDRVREIGKGSPIQTARSVRLSNSRNSINAPLLKSGVTKTIASRSGIVNKVYKTMAEHKKKDPAHEINARPSHAPLSKTLSGFRTTGDYNNADLHFESARLEMQKVGNTISSIERMNESVKFIAVPLDIEILESEVKRYSVVIRALKNETSIQRLDQIVDFSSVLNDAIVPSIAPKISVIDNGKGRKIGVKQLDPRAAGIKIYKKMLNKDSAVDDSYELVSDLSAASGETFNISDSKLSLRQGIYRAVSYDALGRTVGEFSSAVIGKSRISKQRNVEDPVTVFAYETQSGMQVIVHNIPYSVISVRLLRRNLTTHEKKFSDPLISEKGSQIFVNSEKTTASFLDRSLRPDSTFEYKVSLIDTRGNVYESQRSAISHFVGSKSLDESSSLTNQGYDINFDGSERTVTFQIDISSSKTTINQVYDILVMSGLDSQYLDEIKSNRELLNKITAFEIVRFDCMTGNVENFGVVTKGVFEDSSKTRKTHNISSILPGRKYVYFSRLLVRAPGSVFSQANVQRIDAETGKLYTTNLKKFNSPKTLRKGVLSSNVIQKRAISSTGLASDPSSSTNDEMIAGMTSTTIAITVDVPRKDSEVKSVFVKNTQLGNEISWSVFANDREIDHIIVHADYSGRLAPLRAIHFDGSQTMKFIDDVLSSEKIPVQYYVQIVYTNYDMSPMFGPAKVKQ
jgi:hypothetical protein